MKASPTTTNAAGGGSLLVSGALAGLVGTYFMTAAMRHLHRMLPPSDRYPLPPRELTQAVTPAHDEDRMRDASLAAHFGYGAGSGVLLAAVNPNMGPAAGAASGVLIWAASYLGWAPAFGILKPATGHPSRRNALMIGVHLIWGATTAIALRELRLAKKTILTNGPMPDRRE